MSLSKLIAKRRAELRLTLDGVAAKTPFTAQTILNAERGRCLLETEVRIARALGLGEKTIIDSVMVDVARQVRSAA